MSQTTSKKLHIGCGNEVLDGWINHDLAPLPGVDVVHDLANLPWPFEDGEFNEIRMHHVLEHLEESVATVEELYRISAPGARVQIRVPYWNSQDFGTDPTHKAAFNEHTFDYFDPRTRHGRERPYYSTARFEIRSKIFFTKWVRRYREVRSPFAQSLLSAGARHLGGIIWVVEFELIALKD